MQLVPLNNASVYTDIINTTSPVTVILLTNNPSQNFSGLKSLLPAEVWHIFDNINCKNDMSFSKFEFVEIYEIRCQMCNMRIFQVSKL